MFLCVDAESDICASRVMDKIPKANPCLVLSRTSFHQSNFVTVRVIVVSHAVTH